MVESSELEHEFRNLLAALELVAAGTTPSYEPVGTKSGFGSMDPVTGGGELGTIGWLRERWERAADDDGRRALIDEARGKLDELCRGNRKQVKAALDSFDGLRTVILDKGRGVAVFELAMRLRTTVTLIRNVRRGDGWESEYGVEPLPSSPTSSQTASERRDRVRALKDRYPGMSNRQIATMVGCDHKTVADDLSQRAA